MGNLRLLLGVRRIERMLNALIRELCRMMKGLMKLFLSGSPILNEWRLVGLLKVYI